MAAKHNKEFEIDEWDEELDKNPSASPHRTGKAAGTESWDFVDSWEDTARTTPSAARKNNRRSLLLGCGAGMLLVLVLILIMQAWNPVRSGPGPLKTVLDAIQTTPAVQMSAGITGTPVITPTKKPTERPTKRPTETSVPTPTPTAKPTPTPSPTPTQTPSVLGDWYSDDLRYYLQQLSEKEKQCYAQIYRGVAEFRSSISLDGCNCTIEDLEHVMQAVFLDTPELFQLGKEYHYTYLSGYIMDFEPAYRMTQAEYESRCRRIQEVASEIRSALRADADDFDREFAAYRWLIQHCDYLIAENQGTAFADGALVSGKAQCSGYAAALTLLLRHMGVQCLQVQTIDAQNHEWNIVQINGRWYHCDVTWDDPLESDPKTFEAGQDECLFYLNLPDRMMTGHTPRQNGFSLPACTDLADNYTVRQGIYIGPEVSDPAGTIRTRIEALKPSGKTGFMCMIDNGMSSEKIPSFCNKLNLPYSVIFHYDGQSEIPAFHVRIRN